MVDMRRRSSLASLAAAVVAGALIGAGGGAGTYAALSSGSTKTVVRQVPVNDSQPAANTSGLSVNSIYKRTYRGVVEGRVNSQTSDPFGGTRSQSGEGSGLVYDPRGHVIPTQHVVPG